MVSFAFFEERSYGEAFHSGSFASMKATLNIFENNGFVMLKCVMLIAVAKQMLHKGKLRDLMIVCRKCNLFLIGEFN